MLLLMMMMMTVMMVMIMMLRTALDLPWMFFDAATPPLLHDNNLAIDNTFGYQVFKIMTMVEMMNMTMVEKEDNSHFGDDETMMKL